MSEANKERTANGRGRSRRAPNESLERDMTERGDKAHRGERALAEAVTRAGRYLAGLEERSVVPSLAAIASLNRLRGPLPEEPAEPHEVVQLLDECASPATVASAGPRYFGFAAHTLAVIDAIQRDGTCWCGGTVWQGRTAMRISVSSWATTEADIDRSLDAVVRIATALGAWDEAQSAAKA
jgi:hypothetical protein